MSQVARRTSIHAQHSVNKHVASNKLGLLVILAAAAAIIFVGLRQATTSSHTDTISLHQVKPNSAQPAVLSATTSEDTRLNGIIEAWAQKQSFASTVVVKELQGKQREASLKATDSIVTASTFKLYVAYGVLHGIEQGSYGMGTVTNDGKTIAQDMQNMVVNSDNNAARTLGFMIGWPKLDGLLATQGISHTDTNNYVGTSTKPVGDKHSTAADFALFLQKLQAGALLSSSNTQYLLGLLEKQNYRSGIPAGVPAGVPAADKPGWLTPADGIYEYIQNDAGIVYGPKSTYIIVINTSGKSMTPLADLSRQVYNYLQS